MATINVSGSAARQLAYKTILDHLGLTPTA